MLILKDVVSRHYESISPDAPVKDAIEKMNHLSLTMLPVCDQDRVVGVLAEPELRRTIDACSQDPEKARVRDIMCAEVVTGREDEDLALVVAMMRQREISVLPVLDSEERLLGVFTLGGPWRRRRAYRDDRSAEEARRPREKE
jgi:predicted transcriptional regulator